MRITIENFKDHVTPYQLRKGEDYVKKVSGLQRTPTGRWIANVKGRELYQVEIAVEKDESLSVLCNCIAHTENEYCKHVIAVLLSIQQASGIDNSSAGNNGSTAAKGLYVDYGAETADLERSVRTAIAQQDYQKAANTILAMIKSMPPYSEQPDGEDVEYEIIERTNKGFELMVRLSGEAVSQDLQDRMYRRSLDTASDLRWNLFDCKTHWIEVLMVLSKGKETEVLGVIEQLLKMEYNHRFEWVISRLALMKIVLLRRLGREGEVRELAMEYPQAGSLRDMLIREAVEAGDFQSAKQLARDGMSAAEKGRHPVHFAHFRGTLQSLIDQSPDVTAKPGVPPRKTTKK